MTTPTFEQSGLDNRNPLYQLRHVTNLKVIAMGDSSVFGVGDHGDTIPSVGAGWAGRLAHDLGAARFINVAKNGSRARDLVKHQLSAAQALDPELVLICIGTNDVLRGDFSPEEIRESLFKVIEMLDNSKTLIVLLGLPNPMRTAPGPIVLRKILRARVAIINEIYSEIADKGLALFVPTWDSKIAHEKRLWHIDRMHPSPQGHQLIADLVRRKMELPRRSRKKLATKIDVTKSKETKWLLINGTKWFVKRSVDLIPALIWLIVSEKIRQIRKNTTN
jgi:lysophospholipase L1-like esterase